MKYKSILFFGTLQFCGNMIEYFQENTHKLVVYYIMPRKDPTPNMVRLYIDGKLIKEKKFFSPENIVFCYIILYINYIRILFSYFSYSERFFVITGHPLFSFFRSILKIFRKFEIVYFVGDYYPGSSILNIIYQTISQHYHNATKYRFYLSNRLNEKLNGKIINTENVKTIMWGIQEPIIQDKKHNTFTLCFIGVIRDSQGIDLLLDVMSETKNMNLKILGKCDKELFGRYSKKIMDYNLSSRVYFPNQFFYGEDLKRKIEETSVGIALYDVGPENGTYYADPAKVKTYIQYGLPVIMTNAAEVAEYIKKYKAGEVVTPTISSVKKALERIKNTYPEYIKGVQSFASYFEYNTYYDDRFRFLKEIK